VAKGSRHDRGEKTANGSDRGGNGDRDEMEPGTRGSNHLVLLCENLEGYKNLMKLVFRGGFWKVSTTSPESITNCCKAQPRADCAVRLA